MIRSMTPSSFILNYITPVSIFNRLSQSCESITLHHKRPEFYILLLATVLIGCASSKSVFSVPQKMTGVIMVVGNEPLTRIAIRNEGGAVYLINGDQEIREKLLSHQGRIAMISYNTMVHTPRGIEIGVVGVEFLSK